MIFLQVLINYLPVLLNVFFLVTLGFRRDISVILLPHIDFTCLQMLPSLRTHLISAHWWNLNPSLSSYRFSILVCKSLFLQLHMCPNLLLCLLSRYIPHHVHLSFISVDDNLRFRLVKKNRDPRWEEEFQFMLEEPPTNDKIYAEVLSASTKLGLLHPKVYPATNKSLFLAFLALKVQLMSFLCFFLQ